MGQRGGPSRHRRGVRTFGFDPRAVDDEDHARGLLADLLTDPQISGSADLTRAFTAYVDAMMPRGRGAAAASRAERIFVANVSIGAEEQRVADLYVRAAIPGRWITAIIATSHLGLRLPEGVLELSRDVPRPAYLGGAPFPPDLMELDDEDAVEDRESYHERMGYIITLLRAHQRDPSTFELPPGTPAV